MNLAYFPKPDSGIEARAAWAMPLTGFVENTEAQWDVQRTPDHGSIYDQRALLFYEEAVAKLKEYGLGDFPNPYLMVAPDYEHALIGGEGNPAMVEVVRHAAPKDYQPGGPFNPFALQEAWRARLDQIITEARRTHPDIPDPTAFDRKIAEESAATRARANDVASRATFMGKVGGVVGVTGGTMSRDEEITMTALTLPVGGVAGSLARTLLTRLLVTAATDAALGGAQTGINELAESRFQYQHFGYSKSGEEILGDMAYAAAASALLGVGLQGIGEGGAYLLSRWRSRHTALQALETEESGGTLPLPGTVSASGSSGEGPVALGLRSTAEQAQELYSVLPKIGRDAADEVGSELQIVTTGPVRDLATHAQNVAQAAEAVTNGERPIPIDLPGRNYFESETTPDGHQIDTMLEVVEFDELKPGSLLNQQVKRDIDSAIATLKALPPEELIRFRIEGTLTPEGKPQRGGKTVESHLGLGVHKGFRRYADRKPAKYVGGESMEWREQGRIMGDSGTGQEPDRTHSFYQVLVELKPKSGSGKYAGIKQIERYKNELKMRAFSLEWGITRAQYDEIIKIKKHIKHLQKEVGRWAKPKRTRKKTKQKPKS